MDKLSGTEFFESEDLRSEKSDHAGYYESLTHQHTKYMTPDHEAEEMIRENEINFVQGL